MEAIESFGWGFRLVFHTSPADSEWDSFLEDLEEITDMKIWTVTLSPREIYVTPDASEARWGVFWVQAAHFLQKKEQFGKEHAKGERVQVPSPPSKLAWVNLEDQDPAFPLFWLNKVASQLQSLGFVQFLELRIYLRNPFLLLANLGLSAIFDTTSELVSQIYFPPQKGARVLPLSGGTYGIWYASANYYCLAIFAEQTEPAWAMATVEAALVSIEDSLDWVDAL